MVLVTTLWPSTTTGNGKTGVQPVAGGFVADSSENPVVLAGQESTISLPCLIALSVGARVEKAVAVEQPLDAPDQGL